MQPESVCKLAGMLEWKNGAYAAALVLLAQHWVSAKT